MNNYFADIVSRNAEPGRSSLIPPVYSGSSNEDITEIQSNEAPMVNTNIVNPDQGTSFGYSTPGIKTLHPIKEISNKIINENHNTQSYIARNVERVIENNKTEFTIHNNPTTKIPGKQNTNASENKAILFGNDKHSEGERIIPEKMRLLVPTSQIQILKQEQASFNNKLEPAPPAPVKLPINGPGKSTEPPKLTIGKIIVEVLAPANSSPAKVVTKVVTSSAHSSHSRPNRLSIGLRH
ncbi:MAG TPA: hypothetical protein PKD91_04025 [Bacteroidia bacterium]|nr:hypothetical protein [Bacteroidia bacterium]